MKTILLYGFLGRQFGKVHRYDVRSAGEAVRAMCVTLSGFRKAVAEGGAYRVLVAGSDGLDADQLRDPVSDKETIRIVPIVAGAGRGLGQTILGAVLVAAAFAGNFFFPGNPISPYLSQVGFAMILGGVAQMLFAPKQAQSVESPENRPSYSFDGAVNTVAQGNSVPVLYGGPVIVGSQVISGGLSVEQI